MQRRQLATAVLLSVFLGGCLPVLVGGLIYRSSTSRGQKQEFMAQLQRTNVDREARGLRPLDWCSEAYRFDKGWAWEDTNCRSRIVRYEQGDAAALDPPSGAIAVPVDSAGAVLLR
jgi:hypothetical protein